MAIATVDVATRKKISYRLITTGLSNFFANSGGYRSVLVQLVSPV